mgnify:CR=1 FL=1
MEKELYDIVNRVKDPEIPTISVVELGVVRNIELINGKVIVTITPTYSGCPALDVMRNDIALELSESGYEDVEIKTVLSPAWTTDWLTETAKQKLIESNIAPPISTANEYANLLKSVSFLAACSEVGQLWVSGRRHELALSFSGLCLKQNVDPQLLINIIQRICQTTGDRDEQDRMNCVRTSVGKPHDELRGYNGLVDCI